MSFKFGDKVKYVPVKLLNYGEMPKPNSIGLIVGRDASVRSWFVAFEEPDIYSTPVYLIPDESVFEENYQPKVWFVKSIFETVRFPLMSNAVLYAKEKSKQGGTLMVVIEENQIETVVAFVNNEKVYYQEKYETS